MQREVFPLRLSFEDFVIGEGRVIRAMTDFRPKWVHIFGTNHSAYLNVYQLSPDSGGSSRKITNTKKPARLSPCGLSGLR